MMNLKSRLIAGVFALSLLFAGACSGRDLAPARTPYVTVPAVYLVPQDRLVSHKPTLASNRLATVNQIAVAKRLAAEKRAAALKALAHKRHLAALRAAAARKAAAHKAALARKRALAKVSNSRHSGGVAACIRHWESGDNYRAQNPYTSASGGYQFLDSTWRAVTGLSGSAKDYSPATQDAAFWKLWAGGSGAHHWVTAYHCI